MSLKRSISPFVLSLLLLSILPGQVSAFDLGGSSSLVTVRSDIYMANDGVIILEFKALWGDSEFTVSNIFRPEAIHLTWDDLVWSNLSAYLAPLVRITPPVTIEYLFSSEVGGGKTLVASPVFFVSTVLGIDSPFLIRSMTQCILPDFETIMIRAELEPERNAYTISPLRFLSGLDFQGFPPSGEVVIETESQIDLRTSSLSINHFMLPEGHRFKSRPLFGIESSRTTYDIAEDEIHVRNLPPVISTTLIYYLLLGAAFLSMIMVSVAARRAKIRTPKGLGMWVGIGAVCFLAFIPYHMYISMVLIVLGFYRSVQRSRSFLPPPSRGGVNTGLPDPGTGSGKTRIPSGSTTSAGVHSLDGLRSEPPRWAENGKEMGKGNGPGNDTIRRWGKDLYMVMYMH